MKPFELISDDGADSIYVVTDGYQHREKEEDVKMRR